MTTKADWLFIIEDQQRSGLSIAEYCRLNAIPAYALYNARTRYGFTKRKEEAGKKAVSGLKTENEEILITESESMPSDTFFIPVQVEAAVSRSVQRNPPPGIEDDFLDFFVMAFD